MVRIEQQAYNEKCYFVKTAKNIKTRPELLFIKVY